MLSRTADHLFWMARYIERAENLARVLDVTYGMSLFPHAAQSDEALWLPPMQIAGEPEMFVLQYGEFSTANVIRYLVLDESNPSSILSSLNRARENARAVRVAMSYEMWESVNSLWLELMQRVKYGLSEPDLTEFCDWVRSRSHLFRGVTFGTKLRDDGFRFLRLGTMIERADSTARLLDVKYRLLQDQAESEGLVDYYEWSAVLRSVSAFEAYQKVFSDTITPRRVAELLVMNDDMPRSLHACFDEIAPILEQICGTRGHECLRLAGELHAQLHYGRMENVFRDDLNAFLEDFMERNDALGAEIQRTFLQDSIY
jgi:uncharacterized alpha-E superfamily protein